MLDSKEIYSEIKKAGIARKNKFHVNLPIPDQVRQEVNRQGIRLDERTLSMRCYSTQLPPKSIAATDVKIGGFNQKVPYNRTYDDVNMTFILDKEMNVKRIFDIWQEVIAPDNATHVAYLHDIVTDLDIYQLNNMDDTEYQLTLKEAYPIVVNSLDYQTDENDSFHVLSITWTFKTVKNDLKPKGVEIPELSIPQTGITDIQGINISAIMDFANELASFSLEGEALRWYNKIDDYIQGFTGGYSVNEMGQLVKRLEFSVESNSRFTESNKTAIGQALSKLRNKLGF